MEKEHVIDIISRHKDQLNHFQIKAVYLFGSVARGQTGVGSDVDLMVEFNHDAEVGLFEMVRIKKFVSEILNCNADLVTPDAVHPLMKSQIMKDCTRAA